MAIFIFFFFLSFINFKRNKNYKDNAEIFRYLVRLKQYTDPEFRKPDPGSVSRSGLKLSGSITLSTLQGMTEEKSRTKKKEVKGRTIVRTEEGRRLAKITEEKGSGALRLGSLSFTRKYDPRLSTFFNMMDTVYET